MYWRDKQCVYMFSSATKLLDEGEEIEVTIHPSRMGHQTFRKYILATMLIAVIGFIAADGTAAAAIGMSESLLYGLFIVPGFIIALAEVERQVMMYHFTTKKFIMEKGIFNKNFSSVPYRDITRVTINQGLNDRLLGLGNLKVEVKGTDHEEIFITGIRNPQRFRVRLSGSHGPGKEEEGGAPDDAVDTSSAGQTQPLPGRSLTKQQLEAELGRVTRHRNRIKQDYKDGVLSEDEYERQWYMMKGREQLLEQQIALLENQGSRASQQD